MQCCTQAVQNWANKSYLRQIPENTMAPVMMTYLYTRMLHGVDKIFIIMICLIYWELGINVTIDHFELLKTDSTDLYLLYIGSRFPNKHLNIKYLEDELIYFLFWFFLWVLLTIKEIKQDTSLIHFWDNQTNRQMYWLTVAWQISEDVLNRIVTILIWLWSLISK